MNLKVFIMILCLKANFYIFGEIPNANMKHIALIFLLFSGHLLFAQNLPEGTIPTRVNEQRRYTSDSRLFYIWNEQKDAYDLRDTEYESSIIDIREINTHANGY